MGCASGRQTRPSDGHDVSLRFRSKVTFAVGLRDRARLRQRGMRKVKLRGLPNVDWLFVFASAAFNMIRLPKLLARPA